VSGVEADTLPMLADVFPMPHLAIFQSLAESPKESVEKLGE